MKLFKKLATAVSVAAALALSAPTMADGHGEKVKLRIQTHFSPETLSGQMAKEWVTM